MIRWLLAVAMLLMPGVSRAQTLDADVRAILARQGAGTRFGMVVADDAGRELVAINPDDRFVPASNAKIFTTAAALALLGPAAPQESASVHLDGADVVLFGRGDARLSSAADCEVACLAMLADAVAARTRTVRDVVGDDRWFADERWPAGMSWNNMVTWYGAAVSALTLDNNVSDVEVTPGRTGQAAVVRGEGYYRLEPRAVTASGGGLRVVHLPNTSTAVIAGSIAPGAPRVLFLPADDPAHRAAWRLAAMLRERGVAVTGTIRAVHRLPGDPAPAPPSAPLATVTAAPLLDDLRLINKQSHNLRAELLLRRLGRAGGAGSVEDGQRAVAAVLARAGVERWRYDLSDGSGMSTYDRVTPRGTVRFLRWIAGQPWGAAWRGTLPIGGVDGTLKARFVGTPLAGRIVAKTGTLFGAAAISGTMVAASGRTLTFAAFANDMPQDAPVTATLDRALLAIAAAN